MSYDKSNKNNEKLSFKEHVLIHVKAVLIAFTAAFVFGGTVYAFMGEAADALSGELIRQGSAAITDRSAEVAATLATLPVAESYKESNNHISLRENGASQRISDASEIYEPTVEEASGWAERRDYEIKLLAKTVWGEARDCQPDEWPLVCWTVFNRVDSVDTWFGSDVEEVITKEGQFQGYDEDNPLLWHIGEVCAREYDAWVSGGLAPVLEPYAASGDYLYFIGQDGHNWFRKDY